ncbi:MAG TPA: RHS repeat-associated core domain-containing protein [Bacteroidales bacterium]|jgi:RHS repeat-associated protein|nr:RHS repeat-associated core domain-containing protein [Bacteroidales bacterium]
MNEQDSIFYINKDHLGSFDVITNPDGSVRERYNYDPWGRRRNPTDWSYNNVPEEFFLDRGFTGHEHLDKFELINMNGRVYDQVMAMFLSPDFYIQAPDLAQNYNRFSYCLNIPLIYVDPSGYVRLKDIWNWFKSIFTNDEVDSSNDQAENQGGQGIVWIPVANGNLSTNNEATLIILGGATVTASVPEKNTPTTVINDIKNDPFLFENPNDWLTAADNVMGAAGTSAGAGKLYIDNVAGQRITYTKFSGTRGWVSTSKVVSIAKNVGTYTLVGNTVVNLTLGLSGYLTPGETITNLGVNWGAWAVGGWPGLVIGVGYTILGGTGIFDRPAYVTPYSPPNIAVPDALRVSIPTQNIVPVTYPHPPIYPYPITYP